MEEARDPDSISVNALADQPTIDDRLGFTPYVEAIARFLTSEATRPPISISIEGDWGSGKSSFLLQLEHAIGGGRARRGVFDRCPEWLGGSTKKALEENQEIKAALTVRFNAWRHDKQDALWAAFALAFVKALRAEVGLLRAWRGDALLFLRRLHSLRGWLEILLLLLSVLASVIGAIKLWGFAQAHPADSKRLFDWLTTPLPKADLKTEPTSTSMPGATQLWQLASGGTFGTIGALGLAGLYKFRSYVKMPLSFKLEKYIAKPDYLGHASFIETFHLDLERVVKAYAKKQRVFIFVDDLDRCDVPRAADLMQAINLMIGDIDNLVFIIGMDREKVAAGIAQKYKELLPFLRESAQWKPSDSIDNHAPLYFGYSYLEKFIQISFALPIPGDEKTLEDFLREERRPAQEPTWRQRISAYWSQRFRRPVAAGPTVADADEADQMPQATSAAEPDARRIYRRLKIEQDSMRIQQIVKDVSVLFEFNPRRIKQFLNTFRLTLYLASDQGLFDSASRSKSHITPEQIGKVVALLLRFPDLRFALERDHRLLATLQTLAFEPSAAGGTPYHWLEKTGAVDLLKRGCKSGDAAGIYSLAAVDISRLFSILPRVPAPAVAEATGSIAVFDALAERYEKIRAEETPSAARTRKMSTLARRAVNEAGKLSSPAQTLALLSYHDGPGSRLMRILIASAQEDAANLPWLIEMNGAFVSAFEHFWCIKTLIDYLPLTGPADRLQINLDLERRWKEIVSDPGRAAYAQQLLELTREATRTKSRPMA